MNIILYLSSKYLKFKASDRGLSAVAFIALLTIVISCASAVVILSASNGIHYNFVQKFLTRDAHILILGPGKGIQNYDNYLREISSIKGVKSVTPYFEKQGLLKGNLNVWGSVIMGVTEDLYKKDNDFKSQYAMQDGFFNLQDPMSIVMGYNLALNLGVYVGDFVYVTVYNEELLSVQYKFKVKGIFSAGQKDYDSNLAFISFNDAQMVFDSQGYAYGLRIMVDKPFEVEKYLKDIETVYPHRQNIFTWKALHRNDLAALQDEKMLIMIILSFFFIVVAFNILSTMIAMVLDKKEEIGILKAMGLKPSNTLKVFLYDGFFLGVFGSIIGVLSGLLITVTLNDILRLIEILTDFVNFSAYYLAHFIKRLPVPENFHFFNSSVYYIDKFPIQIQYGDILFVTILSISLSTLAVIVPSFKASKMRPIEVLRND